MNETDATRCLAALIVFDRRDWSDPQVTAWTKAIRKCTDVPAAMAASESLVNELAPREWSLHAWRGAYQSAVRSSAPPALPVAEEPVVTLDEYIARLEAHAAAGNARAAEELAIWRKHRHSPFGRALVPEGSS